MDLIKYTIGRATVRASAGTPSISTAKIAGLTVPNSHIPPITNSTTATAIKRPQIDLFISPPQGASGGALLGFMLQQPFLRLLPHPLQSFMLALETKDTIYFAASPQGADSDDLARVYRFDLAQDSEMISPTIPI
ncbi:MULTISPECIES: hypothetical protein [unclassified Bradyrhizobium]|uniref:hypothetical protein n=1 Tax=unclassified Bradyrhizobium TaxID=2631580 RepID=UPI00247864CF|nr:MULTISPECIES: hypothetical protein [unclassified Bradyrhizobium]WGS17116.1 hypothetical protein MTX22_20675 [Bradyrhizobium sp. ISRA463]WGS30841.1 hypothetical protein MTX19_18365 [Bradyrhizobium sp. ISRA464]